MKRKIVSEKHTFSFIFMGALSKLVLITNRLLIMIFETFELARWWRIYWQFFRLKNANRCKWAIQMRSVRRHYTKSMQKNIVFNSAPAKKPTETIFWCVFSLFRWLDCLCKNKKKTKLKIYLYFIRSFYEIETFCLVWILSIRIEVAYRFVINGHHYNNKKVIRYDVISGIVFTCCFSLSSCLRAFCFRTTK